MEIKTFTPTGQDVGTRVTHSVDQAIASAVITILAFDTERWDTDDMHDVAVNNSRITFNRPGKYYFSFSVAWGALVAAGIRDIFVRLNGVTILVANVQINVPSALFGDAQEVSGVYDFAAGDYIEGAVLQSSGVAVSILKVGNYSPEFMAQKIDKGG